MHKCAWTSRSLGCLRVKPFHVATTSSILLTYSDTLVHEHARTHKQTHRPLSLCPSLGLLMPRPLASPLCRMWQVGDVTAVLSHTKSGQSHNHTQTHSSANPTQGLYCRASTEEVRALCPPSSPNFKCHAQRNGATWLTARLLCKDMSSLQARRSECPCTYAGHTISTRQRLQFR